MLTRPDIDRSRLLPPPDLYYGRQLTFDARRHVYRYDGEIVPGVTAILKRLSKGDALVQWSANLAAMHYDAHLDRYVRGEVSRQELYAAARTAWRRSRDDAGDLGRRVHAYLEARLCGKETAEAAADEAQARAAVDKWLAETELSPVYVERRLYSHRHGYAGTCDLYGYLNGQLAVLDVKTSASIYDDMWLQLAAYDIALTEELGPDAAPVAHCLIHIDKRTGTLVPHIRPPCPHARTAWLRLAQFHRAANRMGAYNHADA